MKSALLTVLLSATLLAGAPHAQAQNTQAAAPAAQQAAPADTNVTVNRGPLFLGGIVSRIKNTFKRDTPAVAPVAVAPPRAATTASGAPAGSSYAEREARQQAYWARNRAIANAVNQKVARDMDKRAQEIAAAKAADAAREAGLPVPTTATGQPVAVTATGQPAVPTTIVVDQPVDTSQPKPIFNNYR